MRDHNSGHDSTRHDDELEHEFWALAEPLLDREGVGRSTMMGLPCLRVSGQFFASWYGKERSMVVKLPAARVDELIASGAAEPFSPAGRRFKEWASIPGRGLDRWPALLAEGLQHVSSPPAKETKGGGR